MNKTIIITGCAKRIGLGIANFYLKNSDYKVIGVIRNINQNLKELKNLYPERFELIIKDFDKELLDIHFLKEVIDRHGEIKGFIHCASNLLLDNFESLTYKNLQDQKKIHYDVFNQALMSYLEVAKINSFKTIASFINFGDYKVSYGENVGISYTQSKLLVINSIQEHARNGLGYLRANVISPGYTLPTEGYVEDFEKIVESFPFKYTSNIIDICETVDFLIHQKSVTGQHIVVDAGAGLIDK